MTDQSHSARQDPPEILDPVDVVPAVCKQFRVIYAVVFERTDIQRVVAAPAICVDDAVRNHLAFDDGHESGLLRVQNDTNIDLSATLKALPVNIVSSIPCRATRSQDIDDI